MADQKKWFKVWTSILSDDDFDCSTQEGRDRLARFVWLGAYSALHGNSGKTDLDKDFLLSRLGVMDLSRLCVTLSCKNITFEEGKNRHGKTTVTIAKWVKYQQDSTQAERQRASRSKRRGEERRREEIKKDPETATPGSFNKVESEELKKKKEVAKTDSLAIRIMTIDVKKYAKLGQWLVAKRKELRNESVIFASLKQFEPYAKNGSVVDLWGYLEKIIEKELFNYHEQQAIQESQRHKDEEKQALGIK